jgi:thiosulfate/3-mercaptopyruvate sulfurtransferase
VVVVSALIGADELRARRGDVRVVDLRYYLDGRSGRAAHEAGHVPGAAFVDMHDITAPDGPGRHPIPSPERLTEAMRAAGVHDHAEVVVYDDAGGSVAARLWWLLRAHGHAAVRVLDGGIQAWGGPLEVGPVAVERGTYTAGPRADLVVDREHVRAGRALLLDARAPERFRGEVEPIDPRPGHIPGARSAAFAGNLGPDGRFLGREALAARYRALGVGAQEVVVYCGSGVTACHDILAIELAGLPAPKLYEGSWSDWSRQADLPAELGG